MNIGQYTFEEFKQMAAAFHGYPAPGLLVGGYMVEHAKNLLPENTIFDAVVETSKCLPDAVQLLTLCSFGNGWMKVVNLGRYALTLYDKYTGAGVRVWLDSAKLARWSEIEAWYLKLKPKKEQDTDLLFEQIRDAGPAVCSSRPVQIDPDFFKRQKSMSSIGLCPVCTEAYPVRDGAICRGCQGEAPYVGIEPSLADCLPELRALPLEQAVGKRALHDMTRIIPRQSKGTAVNAGQTITGGDVCRLQTMGRSEVFVQEDILPGEEWVHENDAALAFARAMAGNGVCFDQSPREGKVNFLAEHSGLLVVDHDRLERFNLVPDVMCASRQNYLLVEEGKPFAGCRAIPLYISRDLFSRALGVLSEGPLFEVRPLKKGSVGILVTGTEVFTGLIEDKFAPVIKSKVENLGSQVVATELVPDDEKAIAQRVKKILGKGADLLVTTAGLSVDPGDVTRKGLVRAGLTDVLYGAPLLPGAMTLTGKIGNTDVIGVPACALFHKTTSFDLLLPRLLAGVKITRADLARMAEGGFCLNCRSCTFPKCPFGK